MDEILKIKELKVTFDAYKGFVQAVRGVSFSVFAGEIMALVGESGCGKSVTAQSILRLNPEPPARIRADDITLAGVDILHASEKEMEKVRGQLAGMVFQDPLTCLNPTMKVGRQITEGLYRSGQMNRKECRKEAIRLLELVQIPEASLRAEQYPHQFSGGMRQRAMIAMALSAGPKLLIADEPTTALDVTVQLQVLSLLKKIKEELNTAVLLITHDLTVVANLADRVGVMYAGRLVETGEAKELFQNPSHPYTRGLLGSCPVPGEKGELISILGTPPDLYAPPAGCAFASRCLNCMELCKKKQPPYFDVREGHQSACWLLHPDCPGGMI